MPPADDIQRQLHGAWRMMTGRADGLRLLDLSADGFWDSFFAIVVALPALIVGWVSVAGDATPADTQFAARLGLVARYAIVDIGSWVLPIVGLALVARRAGIADRFVPYVVASNWASAMIVWIMLPPGVVRLMWPEAAELATAASMILFLVTSALSWRLTNAAIGRGAGMATAVFAGMFAASLAVLFALDALLGTN